MIKVPQGCFKPSRGSYVENNVSALSVWWPIGSNSSIRRQPPQQLEV